jgi:hypothetical protein
MHPPSIKTIVATLLLHQTYHRRHAVVKSLQRSLSRSVIRRLAFLLRGTPKSLPASSERRASVRYLIDSVWYAVVVDIIFTTLLLCEIIIPTATTTAAAAAAATAAAAVE